MTAAEDDTPSPALELREAVAHPRAAVLLLHGGRAEGLGPPTLLNLPGLRMRPVEKAIARATDGHDVAVGRVRYRLRGWNGDQQDPAHDTRRALRELALVHGDVPVVLVGHSMGGRAALRVAGHPQVRAVVGLAPWCPDGEPVEHLHDRRVALVHGDRDTTTDPRASAAFADRAAAAGAQACFIPVPGGDHAMLRSPETWHTLAAALVSGLLGLAPMPAEAAPLEPCVPGTA